MFNSQFYQQTDGVATTISKELHSPKLWEPYVDEVHFILKRSRLENFFFHMNNLNQSNNFTMKEESNVEVMFLEISLERNNGKYLYWYIGNLHILTNSYITTLTTKQVRKA